MLMHFNCHCVNLTLQLIFKQVLFIYLYNYTLLYPFNTRTEL